MRMLGCGGGCTTWCGARSVVVNECGAGRDAGVKNVLMDKVSVKVAHGVD